MGFASSYGASENMLSAGRAKTCIWGEVGLLDSLTHPMQVGFLSERSPSSGRERRRISGKIQLSEVDLC